MKRLTNRKRGNRRGFTLMEVLLVLVILVILGSMAGVFIQKAQKNAMVDAARTQIRLFEGPLDMYQMHMNKYPATQEGLAVLRTGPSSTTSNNNTSGPQWKGPYLQKAIPKDPWGNDYQYELLQSADQYRIWSWGPDGNNGTDDDIQTSGLEQ